MPPSQTSKLIGSDAVAGSTGSPRTEPSQGTRHEDLLSSSPYSVRRNKPGTMQKPEGRQQPAKSFPPAKLPCAVEAEKSKTRDRCQMPGCTNTAEQTEPTAALFRPSRSNWGRLCETGTGKTAPAC